MRSNNNSVSSLQYHIIWCTKYRHPILTGAVEVEAKTILAQVCAEYGWTLKAIEVMPDHVHLFLEASPDEAPSTIARMLRRSCPSSSDSIAQQQEPPRTSLLSCSWKTSLLESIR